MTFKQLTSIAMITALTLPNTLNALTDEERDRTSSSALSITITEEQYNSMQAGSLTQAASFETEFERTRQQHRTMMKYGMIVGGMVYGMMVLCVIAIGVYNVTVNH